MLIGFGYMARKISAPRLPPPPSPTLPSASLASRAGSPPSRLCLPCRSRSSSPSDSSSASACPAADPTRTLRLDVEEDGPLRRELWIKVLRSPVQVGDCWTEFRIFTRKWDSSLKQPRVKQRALLLHRWTSHRRARVELRVNIPFGKFAPTGSQKVYLSRIAGWAFCRRERCAAELSFDDYMATWPNGTPAWQVDHVSQDPRVCTLANLSVVSALVNKGRYRSNPKSGVMKRPAAAPPLGRRR